MQKSFFFVGLFLSAFFACKNDPKNTGEAAEVPKPHAAPIELEGNWINADFVSRAMSNGSIIKTINNTTHPFAYTYTFSSKFPDSVFFYNGLENGMLPVKYDHDTIEIVGAVQGKSIYMIYQSQTDKAISLIDGTGPRTTIDRYTKTRDGALPPSKAFHTALNHNLFGAVFTPLGGKTKDPVTFVNNGVLLNFPGYDQYELCIAGDCFATDKPSDVIYLNNSKTQSGQFFAFNFSTQLDTLTLFNLQSLGKDLKGSKIGGKAFSFLRAKPVK